MCIEIEAKLKVASFRETERKLAEVGAEFLAEQFQTDYHFDDSDATLERSDACLRLRRQTVGAAEVFFLTYKGPRQESSLKRRREIEVEIKDADSTRKLLGALGYAEVFVVEKERRLWRFGGCLVALDRLPLLGDFVEIEGPGEDAITKVQSRLDLSGAAHIAGSYVSLMKAGLRRRGGTENRVDSQAGGFGCET